MRKYTPYTRRIKLLLHGPLARYVILRVAHAPGMPGKFSPPPRFSDPDMHHGTCVTHVPWCMSGSLTSSFLWSRPRGKTFPAFPAHAQPAILRIWQEAHARLSPYYTILVNVSGWYIQLGKAWHIILTNIFEWILYKTHCTDASSNSH